MYLKLNIADILFFLPYFNTSLSKIQSLAYGTKEKLEKLQKFSGIRRFLRDYFAGSWKVFISTETVAKIHAKSGARVSFSYRKIVE